jgi:hypothetical protein
VAQVVQLGGILALDGRDPQALAPAAGLGLVAAPVPALKPTQRSPSRRSSDVAM